MNKLLIFFIVIFDYSQCLGQNLVPNSSFEEKYSCPVSPGQIDTAKFWTSFGVSPDYFDSCAASCTSSTTCLGIPQNIMAFQAPHSGQAYAGIVTYSYNHMPHEFLGVQLVQSLDIGKKYYVSAYICRADRFITHGASNNIGFRFFNVPYSENNSCPIDNFSHVNDSIVRLDSVNWTLIYGSFIADSAYKYLAIGNFYDDQHTDSVDMNVNNSSGFNKAYYLIDDICVTSDSMNCNVITSINDFNHEYLTILPNPFNNFLHIEVDLNNVEILIYQYNGRLVFSQAFSQSVDINTSFLEEGFYFYTITDRNNRKYSGRLIK